MIFNQIKYKWQNNNIEITENILSSMARDKPRFANIDLFYFSSFIFKQITKKQHFRKKW